MTPDASWALDPGIVIALATYLGVYGVRWHRARAEVGPRAASGWRLASFSVGTLALFAALASPLDILGEQLFVMHMAQHVLLLDVAPILLILGLTKVILRPVTARLQAVERKLGPLSHPAFAVAFYAGTLWVWHIPAMYQLSLRHPLIHVLQHVNFAAAGLLFWWHLLSPIRSPRRLRGIGIVFYFAGAKLLTGLLASLITFSREPWYSFYDDQPDWLGLSGLTDQHLAGALMMVQESLFLTIAFAVLFVRMLAESEEDERREERFGSDGALPTDRAASGNGAAMRSWAEER